MNGKKFGKEWQAAVTVNVRVTIYIILKNVHELGHRGQHTEDRVFVHYQRI